MGDVDTFNRYLVSAMTGRRGVRILCAPTATEVLSQDEAMVLAAHLLRAAGCDRERFRVVLDAVLDT
jgi:hypothetical protein